MVSFDTEAHLQEVWSRFDQCVDHRFKEIMRREVYHLHACVSELQSPDEDRMQARANIRTDSEGRYSFWSIKPNYCPIPTDGPAVKMQAKSGRHPNRPGHVHFKISAPDGFYQDAPITPLTSTFGSPNPSKSGKQRSF